MFAFIGLRRRPVPAIRRAVRSRPRPAVAAAAPDDPPEPGCGCGWFDSSWELRHGLEVIEHLDADLLPSEMPLAWVPDTGVLSAPA